MAGDGGVTERAGPDNRITYAGSRLRLKRVGVDKAGGGGGVRKRAGGGERDAGRKTTT